LLGRRETRLDGAQRAGRAKSQPGADEDDDCECDLRDDERPLNALLRAALARGSTARVQPFVQPFAVDSCGNDESNQETGYGRHSQG
jgi:hypothetical protein